MSSSCLHHEPNLKTIVIVDQRQGQRSGCKDNLMLQKVHHYSIQAGTYFSHLLSFAYCCNFALSALELVF